MSAVVVIQCAARKSPQAGHLRTRDGRKVIFVADPGAAPENASGVYARPDEISDDGVTWRTALRSYNENPGDNSLDLLPALRLYENPTYELLANRYGMDRLYILSAGWGLIRADFLTPYYDITFSPSADRYKRRRRRDRYDDFRMLPADIDAPVIFFGGRDYVPLFAELTNNLRTERRVLYNSTSPPEAPGCRLARYRTSTRTNWHYECARAFVEGRLSSL